jgi:hypothetical protein
VYGWSGAVSTSSAGPISTMRPRYITATRSADRPGEPEVVRDDEDREAELVPELEQELQDLSAHGGVEVRDRLVRDDHSGSSTSAPAMTTRCR